MTQLKQSRLVHAALVGMLFFAIIQSWMVLVWYIFGDNPPFSDFGIDSHNNPSTQLEALSSDDFGDVFVGVWRRWDAIFYLSVAENGYLDDYPGATAFGPLPR